MENMMKTMREHFPARTVVIEQSLDMFGIKRNEDGTLLFPRQSDKRFPVARIRKRLAAYGWRGERLNKEVARIVAGLISSLTGGDTALFSLTDGRRSS